MSPSTYWCKFREDLDRSPNKGKVIDVFLNFTRVNDKQRVRNWIHGKSNPQGESRIRARVFLDVIGYNVREFKKLPNEIKSLAMYFCFGIISMSDILEGLPGYHERAITRLFSGEMGTKGHEEEVHAYVSSLNQHRKRVLENRKKELINEVSRLLGSLGKDIETEDRETPLSQSASQKEERDSDMVTESFSYQVQALLPLAGFLFSDTCSDDERRTLREKIPDDGLFELATFLNALCSREARLDIIQKSPRFRLSQKRSSPNEQS